MRNRAVLTSLGHGVRQIGVWVAGVSAKVNPDVWREAGYVSLSAYSLLMPRSERVVPKKDDGFAPVVFVHGLGGTRGAWWPLRTYLAIVGHRRMYAFGYGKGSFMDHVERLTAFIEEVLQATGAPAVDVVTHSLGGLISRYAIQKLLFGQKVRTLVTMACMHHGTYAAFYANTEITKLLRPDSELIAALNHDKPECYPKRFVSIGSDRDIYVVPAESMQHPYAENLFVPGISHAQYLVSPRIFRLVAQLLEPLERPVPS